LRIWPAFDRHTLRSTQEARIYDRMLGYAMTVALKESFAIIKQNLWLRELLTDVGAVQAGARRKTNDTTIALFVKRNNNKNDNKTSNRILQLIAIKTRMVTPPMIVSGANGWRLMQIRPTVPLQSTLQATKANAIMTVHPMPELSMQIRISSTADIHRRPITW